MKALDILIEISKEHCGFFSTEKPCQKATNSELRRWFKNKSIIINGTTPNWDDEIDLPLNELVLFPKSLKRKCTII